MISLTRIDHGVAFGCRHGRSLALSAYQRKTGLVNGVVNPHPIVENLTGSSGTGGYA
jgi:hypothetical protein